MCNITRSNGDRNKRFAANRCACNADRVVSKWIYFRGVVGIVSMFKRSNVLLSCTLIDNRTRLPDKKNEFLVSSEGFERIFRSSECRARYDNRSRYGEKYKNSKNVIVFRSWKRIRSCTLCMHHRSDADVKRIVDLKKKITPHYIIVIANVYMKNKRTGRNDTYRKNTHRVRSTMTSAEYQTFCPFFRSQSSTLLLLLLLLPTERVDDTHTSHVAHTSDASCDVCIG
jgi:hypothetical protein